MYHNVLSDDLSGCMHVNSTGYIFQVGAQFNINFHISSGKNLHLENNMKSIIS